MFTVDTDTNTLTIIKKDTASLDIEFTNYIPADGDTVIFTVAATKESEEPLIQKVITNFPDGIATVELDSAETDLDKGSYYYDIQVNTVDGRVDTVIGPAKFKVLEGVTY